MLHCALYESMIISYCRGRPCWSLPRTARHWRPFPTLRSAHSEPARWRPLCPASTIAWNTRTQSRLDRPNHYVTVHYTSLQYTTFQVNYSLKKKQLTLYSTTHPLLPERQTQRLGWHDILTWNRVVLRFHYTTHSHHYPGQTHSQHKCSRVTLG